MRTKKALVSEGGVYDGTGNRVYSPTNLPVGMAAPSDHGFTNWTYDPAVCSGAVAIPTAGTLYGSKILNRTTITVSSATVYVGTTAGASLTHVGFGLYSGAGALLTSSVDTAGATATAFQSSGAKVITFTPQTFTDAFYVAFWVTGTTMPTLGRSSYLGVDVGLSAPNLRFFGANTGLTTTAPATLGAQTAPGNAYWVGVS